MPAPQDDWTARLYQKHGLGENPSLEQIKPIALGLIGSPSTFPRVAQRDYHLA